MEWNSYLPLTSGSIRSEPTNDKFDFMLEEPMEVKSQDKNKGINNCNYALMFRRTNMNTSKLHP